LPLIPGANLGPYRIISSLSHGGMASVYKAYEAALDRYVAIKVFPPEFLSDPDFAERFRREAKVIARLEHPHIIPVYAFGIDERQPWIAMRLIDGGNVSSLLQSGRLEPTRAVAILGEVAAALEYSHREGVVHRGVKPQNILLHGTAHVYLADFGVARMVEGSTVLTRTGMMAGTPQYMAPEQALEKKLDHRCDIYALGVVAYEMLTGRVPFTADTPVAVLMKHLTEPIPLPSPEDVPEPLTRAVLKSMAKEPADRWPSATDFARALNLALPGEAPTHAQEEPALATHNSGTTTFASAPSLAGQPVTEEGVEEDRAHRPALNKRRGLFAKAFGWWLDKPWLMFWAGLLPLAMFPSPSIKVVGIILVYASWIRGVQSVFQRSRVLAVAIVAVPLALFGLPAMLSRMWGQAFVTFIILAGVPALVEVAVRVITRRRSLSTPREDERVVEEEHPLETTTTDHPPLRQRWIAAIRQCIVAALLLFFAFVFYFVWNSLEPTRNALATKNAIRSGMTLSEVVLAAEGRFFATGSSQPRAPDQAPPPRLQIGGGGQTYSIRVGDKFYGSSLTEDELLKILKEKAGEISPPEKLRLTFRAEFAGPAGLTVTFGENGRVEKIN